MKDKRRQEGRKTLKQQGRKKMQNEKLKEELNFANISTQHSNTGLKLREHSADSKWLLAAPNHQDTGL
jgi:hypothetical protein